MPWLKTVVKHEALAVRRQRERAAPVTDDGEPVEPRGAAAATHDQAERYERLRVGAEALKRLKSQEVRCLLLRAEGHSYKQICEITGFSYTKVNRCLSEGRRAFFDRLEGIEAGAECERLEPLLSALADGEAGAEELAALRPHLKTCLSCRARLREYRTAPTRVAALVPPALVAAGAGGDGPGGLRSLVESIVGATHDKAAALGERAHAAAELATGQKLAAVAASAAAIAGGGAGVERLAERDGGVPAPARPRRPNSPARRRPPTARAPAARRSPKPTPAPAPASAAGATPTAGPRKRVRPGAGRGARLGAEPAAIRARRPASPPLGPPAEARAEAAAANSAPNRGSLRVLVRIGPKLAAIAVAGGSRTAGAGMRPSQPGGVPSGR